MRPEMHPMQMGLFLLVTGMLVVFAALITLMMALKLIRYLEHRSVEKAAAAKAASAGAPAIAAVEPDVSGVLMAAIATTLLLDAQRVEEDERLVLTVRALPKPYSNWWQSRIARAPWDARITPGRAEGMRTSGPHQP